MKKFLFSVLAFASMVFSAQAINIINFDTTTVTYMRIITTNGDTIKYNVENVSEVDYKIIDTVDATQGVNVSGIIGNHSYVDLGLSSGIKWATYNVGASKSIEYGDYFAWGETEPKDIYTAATYKFETDSFKTIDKGAGSWKGYYKYTVDDKSNQWSSSKILWYDSDGNFIGDSLTTLLPEDDAATVNWGSEWRMPTKEEWQELIDGCERVKTEDYNGSGVAGWIYTSKVNGNSIFFPAAGERRTVSYNVGEDCEYWSSSILRTSGANFVYNYFFSEEDRSTGLSVRAVSKAEATQSFIDNAVTYMCVKTNDDKEIRYDVKNVALVGYEEEFHPFPFDTTSDITVSGEIGGYSYVDLGLESGLKWATYNIGAKEPTEYGDYYSWGETFANKVYYNELYYKWYDAYRSSADEIKYTKYVLNSKCGVVDSLGTLESEDDIATISMGDAWRMPTETEMVEFIEGCYWAWTDNYRDSGVAGLIGFSKVNGNVVFLPAAGDCIVQNVTDDIGKIGSYWTSSLNSGYGFYKGASSATFSSTDISIVDSYRYGGKTVRAVSER